ncbi:hypothetical protein, partial [Kingella denitrificans]
MDLQGKRVQAAFCADVAASCREAANHHYKKHRETINADIFTIFTAAQPTARDCARIDQHGG